MEGILIKYNRKNGERIVHEYKGPDGYSDAMNAKLFSDSIANPQDGWEVVVIGSDSLSTVERTHSRYFSGLDITGSQRMTQYA
jgi:hypothetical protein